MGLVGAVVVLVGFGAAPALAATRISGCFSYRGVRYQNLSTSVLYRNTLGGWSYLRGSGWRTNSSGCVTYNIGGRSQNWSLLIKATGAVPNWRGMFSGTSHYYAPGYGGSYYLGEGRLAFYYLPSTAPTPPNDNWSPGNWLAGMSNGGGGGGCSSSDAMAVACYMNSHNLNGNVIVPYRDSDGDGYFDYEDYYPTDSSRH